MQKKLLGIISVDSDTKDHIFCIHQILEKKWEYNEAVHQLFIDFKKAYDSVRRAVLHYILIEFGIPMELVRLIKMCLLDSLFDLMCFLSGMANNRLQDLLKRAAAHDQSQKLRQQLLQLLEEKQLQLETFQQEILLIEQCCSFLQVMKTKCVSIDICRST